ncbi:oxygen-independent coproporphyrinogen III oxidase [Reichenbachiella sp. 5M10]|uniref:oxygen-independent coproporphyrinogen III oxidase n=1 Tax=Reichenbachiella sp. 5M10 TaxID=1889772 RepID=UPI000C158CC4|nr:oxygen-independent coproporphyrinogen III oxidase [Reichenbachiella sp. 5M10]PIB35408.1 oxygen-independent coproporphyrinogen III oxidase [Reichenbachiella sp. 5M10]
MNKALTPPELIRKYNIPGPRYTSYPPIPDWTEKTLQPTDWAHRVAESFRMHHANNGLSLYIHLPYCESLCTYCGCNTRITVNHAVEEPYIDALLQEWQLYLALFDQRPHLAQIHLGGGTPTFFSPDNLQRLIDGLLAQADLTPHASLSFEAHPNNTTATHLQTLYDLGFRRISLGIQDFDIEVQKIVHRIQTFETVSEVVENARNIGYNSINFDLIYGLPKQTLESVRMTFEKVAQLVPDRIAFYSYAHVPWVKPGQRSFSEADLPSPQDKRDLYELGKVRLSELGYHEIGMDHFARATDELYIAAQTGKLHRNFMGYTTHTSDLLLGLGASSIGDTGEAYGQNIKGVEAYMRTVAAGHLPVYRGHLLSPEQHSIRKHITNLMCRFETKAEVTFDQQLFELAIPKLDELVRDELINLDGYKIRIKESGRPFVRNISMAFDQQLWKKNDTHAVYSQTI